MLLCPYAFTLYTKCYNMLKYAIYSVIKSKLKGQLNKNEWSLYLVKEIPLLPHDIKVVIR